jgi:hypothetical protein
MPVQDFTACRSRLTRVRELCRRWRSASRVWGAQVSQGCCNFLQLSIRISTGPLPFGNRFLNVAVGMSAEQLISLMGRPSWQQRLPVGLQPDARVNAPYRSA